MCVCPQFGVRSISLYVLYDIDIFRFMFETVKKRLEKYKFRSQSLFLSLSPSASIAVLLLKIAMRVGIYFSIAVLLFSMNTNEQMKKTYCIYAMLQV